MLKVHHLNNSGISTASHLSDNAIVSFQSVNLIEAPGMGNASVDGSTNWVSSGTDATGLLATISGGDAMLDADYRPQPGSPLIGAALSLGSSAPTSEYYFNETTTAQARARATAIDIGAFESTTMGGPDGGTMALPDLSSPGFMTDLAAQDLPHDLGGNRSGKSSSGCGCDLGARTPDAPWWMMLLALYLARARWRSPEKVCASTRPSPEP